MSYPHSARIAEAIIINSESLRSEVEKYLEVDPRKLRLVYEAVDHDLFKPGDAAAARARIASYGSQSHSCCSSPRCGLIRTVMDCCGPGRWPVASWGSSAGHCRCATRREVRSLPAFPAAELGISSDVVFVGAVPLEDTVPFYRAADMLVYPSFNETFGLPILEAMACGCPVVTSEISSMPEIAGGAAILVDPKVPASIARGITQAAEPQRDRLRDLGLRRARQFTWAATAAATLDVYREAAERRRYRRK